MTLQVRRTVRDATLLRAAGRTHEEIAHRLGVNRAHVRNLLLELERQAHVHLRKRGIEDWRTVLNAAVRDGLDVVTWPGERREVV